MSFSILKEQIERQQADVAMLLYGNDSNHSNGFANSTLNTLNHFVETTVQMSPDSMNMLERVSKLADEMPELMKILDDIASQDMSSQTIQHSIEEQKHLLVLAEVLANERNNLNEKALRDSLEGFKNERSSRKSNPVSASSMTSGDIDLF